MAEKGFVSGGTVQAGGGIYIVRQADQELFELCIAGEYASVLAARQRGKSSLMANVTEKLRSANIHVATIDISPFGETDNPNEWYVSILEIAASQLGLDIDLTDWWEEQAHRFPIRSRRFKLFFQNEVLKTLPGRVVIFIDEIDKTLTLPFTDDFFISIRELYNSRSQDAEFQRLSFVLLGVAIPTDLIKSDTSTPFNIGEQIELTDFTLDELEPFVAALAQRLRIESERARLIAYWIYHWTEGHPYLSNRLFKTFAERMASTTDWDDVDLESVVKDLVNELFLKRLTGTIDSNIMEVKQRLDLRKLEASGALDLYRRILSSPLPVLDADEDLGPKTILKLAGVVKSIDGELTIRNRIYEEVFGQKWFKETFEKTFKRPLDETGFQSKQESPAERVTPRDYGDKSRRGDQGQEDRRTRPGTPEPFVADIDPFGRSGTDRRIPIRAEDIFSDGDRSPFSDETSQFGAMPPTAADTSGDDGVSTFETSFDEDWSVPFGFDDTDDFQSFDDFDLDEAETLDQLDGEEERGVLGSLFNRFRRKPAQPPSDEKTDLPGDDGSSRGKDSLLKRIETEAAESRPGRIREARPRPAQQADGYVYREMKAQVQRKLLTELDHALDPRSPEVRARIEELFNAILAEENYVLARAERRRLLESIVAEILGYGPLDPLLADDTITDIMVNGPKNVFVERSGNLTRVNVTFEDDDHVLRVINRMIAPLGHQIDENSPTVTFSLPDGSRGVAVTRPTALYGPSLTLRKIARRPLSIEDLIRFGTITPPVAEFLRACVIAGLNTLVVGGAGSGKTSLLNVLARFIPSDERIITVENTAELQLQQEHVVALETRPPNIERGGEINIQTLIDTALAMRPDRIIFGSLRRSDVDSYIDTTLQVPTMATLAAAVDWEAALSLLEIGVMGSNPNWSLDVAREWIGGAIQLVVAQNRLRDGSRKITEVLELARQGRGRYGIEPIFQFEQTGIEAGKVIGRIRPTGYRPSFMDQVENAGIHLPPSVFGVGSSVF